jgi:biotin transporter BioY
MLCGNVVIYLCGHWLAGTNLEKTLQFGLYPFVVGDLIKLYLAALLLPLPGVSPVAPGRQCDP